LGHELLKYFFFERKTNQVRQESIMKKSNNMHRQFQLSPPQFTAWVIGLTIGLSGLSLATPTDLATSPLQTTTSSTVLPNIMFMLDDSGSMDTDSLPDIAKNFSGNYGFNSNQCNGVYYDPANLYTPPVDSVGNNFPTYPFTAAPVDGYAYRAGTNTNVVNLNNAFTGGSGSGSSGLNLSPTVPAFYYNYTGSQTSGAQKNYFNSSSTFYQECNSGIGSAPGNAVFTKVSLSSTLPTTTITIPNNVAVIKVTAPGSPTNSKVNGITVGGLQIMKAATSQTTSAATLAGLIKAAINLCTTAIAGSCTTTGYSATVGTGTNTNIITITGPGGAISFSPAPSGNLTEAVTTAFPTLVATSVTSIIVNGVNIVSGGTTSTTSNITMATNIKNGIGGGFTATVGTGANANVVTITGPLSASNSPAVVTTSPAQSTSGRLTVPNATFTQASTAAALQNFSNWYTYYSTRMLMMKTGVGQAFSPPSTSKFRIGFMTMNNNVSPDIVDIAKFDGNTTAVPCAAGSGLCQKDLWYTKLYASTPGNSTPLREALSHVGQLYAHKFGSVTTYKATITVSGSGDTAIDGITVNGTQLFLLDNTSNTIPTPLESSTNALATDISNQINAPSDSPYGATVSGNVVTILGPASANGYVPQLTDIGSMTETATAFTPTTTTASLNGIQPADPVQYSCQQNFVILSTDGYWNGPNTYNLQNTDVGEQDSVEPRPWNDGGTAGSKTTTRTLQRTSQLQQTTAQIQSDTANLQSSVYPLKSSTANLQSQAWQLQSSTKPNSSGSYSVFGNASTCTYQTTNYPKTKCQYIAGAVTSNVSSCPNVPKTTNTADNTVWDPAANTCSYSSYTTAAPASSCIYQNKSTGTGTWLPAVTCSYGTTPVTTVGPCLPIPLSTSTTNGSAWTANATICTYSNYLWVNTSSCTISSQSTTAPYAATAVDNCRTTNTSIGVASCTPSASGGTTVTCPGAITTGPTAVAAASCAAATAISTNNWITTTCTPEVITTATSTCTTASASSTNGWTATSCTPGVTGTPSTLADVAEYYYKTDLRDGLLGNCTGALGSGTDVCVDNVGSSASDKQYKDQTLVTDTKLPQHMTTFTLGLGARGKMVYASNYKNLTTACDPATDGDFCAVLKGSTANGTNICSWQTTSGTICNWPAPASGLYTNVDDLWHAAVNGRGRYFSATDPNSLAIGLNQALSDIEEKTGAASASATSSPILTQTNNYIYSTTYLSQQWTGNVESRTIDPITGQVNATVGWSAQPLLDTLINSDTSADKSVKRTVYMFDTANASGSNLKPFLYGSMTASEKIYFDQMCTTTGGTPILSQCTASLAPTTPSVITHVNAIAIGNSGSNLVAYLRGSTAYEIPGIFRTRTHFLGDTVNSKPLYIQFPTYSFGDTGYGAYITAQTTTTPRQGVLYVGANDGMLHAFNATTGNEMWAYIPKIVMPNLYKLADVNYANNHNYYVDGSPSTMDIYVPTATNNLTVGWHTILVGSLSFGGQGYYALDVTDPAHPKALWEICSNSALCAIADADMGYSYGNPTIVKRSTDGKWVVLLTSGYNNAGSGLGTLYELDAVTGTVLYKTTTDTAATNPPSGLAKLSPWIDNVSSNMTARYVYGGDLNGKVWRFDLGVSGADIAPTATKIASLVDGSGVAQSVTTRPELGDPLSNVSNSLTGAGSPGVFVATGRYLGGADLSNYQAQSVYGIKDNLSLAGAAANIGNPRSPNTGFSSFVRQYLYQPISTARTVSQNAVNWSTNSGWYTDFVVNDSSNSPITPSPSPGERVNIDPQLVNGSLLVVTNVPYESACTAGGTSWLYSFNYLTGTNVTGFPNVGQILNDGKAMTAGFTVVETASGALKAEVTNTLGSLTTMTPPTNGTGSTQQTSWRELVR
jgi:type IV pilus assembly protein PilY1